MTDEATRAARDVATVFTRELAPTVITDSSKVERPRPRGRAAAVIAALVVILIAAGAATMLREQQKVPASTPVHSAAVAATVVPRASGHLGINAFPWAEVRRVRDLDGGQDVELSETLVTPARLDLTPGRYEITLANPSFDKPITKMISIGSGEESRVDVQFSDADTAAVPDFGAPQ